MAGDREAGGAHRWRRSPVVEHLRASLWFVPTVAVTFACGVAVLLTNVEPDKGSWLQRVVYPGGADSARGILQSIAGSVITVTGVVFSLTVVTLQLASTQFSPRLLRTFLRNLGNQVVLATFLATFAYCLVVLRAVRSGTEQAEEKVPAIAISGAYVLTAASVVALVYFIDHIARSIRIDSLLRTVTDGTSQVVSDLDDRAASARHPVPPRPDGAVALPAPRSGFVQAIDEVRLLEGARTSGWCIWLAHPIGDRVISGAPVAWAWRSDRDGPPPERLRTAVAEGVRLGYERTMQQDVAFGVRQLVDVAVKALSPGINDPTTAVHAIGHLAHLLVVISRSRLGDRVLLDDLHEVSVVVPGRTFESYVDLACAQIRRYGAGEPAVTYELLRLLLDVATADHAGAHGDVLLRHSDLTLRAAQRATSEPSDLDALRAASAEIRRTVAEARLAGARAARDDA